MDAPFARLRRILAGSPLPASLDGSPVDPIVPEYPLHVGSRYGYSRPPHPGLADLLNRRRDQYAGMLDRWREHVPLLARIPAHPTTPGEPYWVNRWFTGLDAVALYAMLVERNPRIYLEVGSGCSTLFARRAIRDHHLRTAIISVDPAPRAEVAAICDDRILMPLQDIDADRLPSLGAQDIFFFDGSHYVFSNTDTTVALLETVPATAPGTLLQFHDVYLPWDYPPEWRERHYGEQFLIAACLLGGDDLVEVVLANFLCSRDAELHSRLEPLWQVLRGMGAATEGLSLWLARR
jgi:Methyltransferase domain